MNQKERIVIASVLALIALFVGADIWTDSREGGSVAHVLFEGAIALAALWGVFYILRGGFELKHRLEKSIQDFSDFREQTEIWKSESSKYVEGLSKAIDQQLDRWKLTHAEKEVALLLLKGLSLKEIAQVRQTSEKTARVQSMAVYAKSGLSGRSELAAFFLEDLLLPAASSLPSEASATE